MIQTATQKIYDELEIITPDFEDRPLHSFVEQHAAEIGDRPALQYATRSINYAEYNRLGNQAANMLSKLGVGKGDVVGLHMPNIPQYPITLLALSKLGAIGSGVSPLLAPPELAYQVDNAGIKVLVSFSDLLPTVQAMPSQPESLQTIVLAGARDYLDAPEAEGAAIDGVDLKHWLAEIRDCSDQFDGADWHWNDTMMIQYTGGTTGPPKGAELSLRNVMHNPGMVAATETPHEVGNEVFASAFPMFHAAGMSFVFSCAISGAMMYLLPNPRDIEGFIEMMKRFPPTRLAAVPALYDMLLAHPEIHEVDFSRLDSAKTGAAPMTRTTYNNLSKVIGENKITDVFGMTETGPCYTAHPVRRYKSGSVGFAAPGAEIRIMDVDTGTEEMPVGEPGEICCCGPQVMKGYLNLPEESARALREMDGKLWMYSGDVGYVDDEGYLFLCDRAKDMLIVGGFKVFSVELEDKLKSLPQVGESAIIGVADKARPGNDIVNLYVQLSEAYLDADHDQVKADILAFCKENMSAYKVPKAIHIIDEIPLTPVGKIDKKALRVA
ncbi:MAG: AMP-binding protein [Gammaproteobacteria bacterium]|nr:AMP-binding protein [Gammaproteobacteria bacterium]